METDQVYEPIEDKEAGDIKWSDITKVIVSVFISASIHIVIVFVLVFWCYYDVTHYNIKERVVYMFFFSRLVWICLFIIPGIALIGLTAFTIHSVLSIKLTSAIKCLLITLSAYSSLIIVAHLYTPVIYWVWRLQMEVMLPTVGTIDVGDDFWSSFLNFLFILVMIVCLIIAVLLWFCIVPVFLGCFFIISGFYDLLQRVCKEYRIKGSYTEGTFICLEAFAKSGRK